MSQGSVIVKALLPQERRFVAEYLIDFKALPAAIRAGYSKRNTGIGSVLLGRPHIADEIVRRCTDMQLRLQVDADDVRRGLALIATHPFGPDKGGPTWGDRIAAWRELGKLMGLYQNKIVVTGSLSLVDLLLAADRKIEERAALPPPAH
jgi:hypothetical protein